MENQETTSQPMSLGNRILNVFSSPTEAFDGIETIESKTSLWLPPMLVAMLVAIAFAFLIFTNEGLRDQIVEMQSKAVQEQVDKGRITQAQADQQTEAMQGMGMLFAVIGAVGAIVMVAIYFFGGSLILWLSGKLVLKSTQGYSTFLATYGISAWIFALGSIVGGLMMIGLGSMFATPSAALAVYEEFNPMNTTHATLAKIELFAIWQAVVVGIGLSKLSQKPLGTGIGVAFVLWILWVAASVFVGSLFS